MGGRRRGAASSPAAAAAQGSLTGSHLGCRPARDGKPHDEFALSEPALFCATDRERILSASKGSEVGPIVVDSDVTAPDRRCAPLHWSYGRESAQGHRESETEHRPRKRQTSNERRHWGDHRRSTARRRLIGPGGQVDDAGRTDAVDPRPSLRSRQAQRNGVLISARSATLRHDMWGVRPC